MPSFKYITETATKPARTWSNKNVIRFHAFNPNGAIAAKRAFNQRIFAAVDAGLIPSGWILAHGSGNDYHDNAIMSLVRKGRVSDFKATYHAECIYKDIAEAEAKLVAVVA